MKTKMVLAGFALFILGCEGERSITAPSVAGTPIPGAPAVVPVTGVPAARPPGAVPVAATPVPDCAVFDTLGGGDAFIARRCGVNVACHATGSPWTDLTRPGISELYRDRPAKVVCPGDKLIDTGDWTRSLLLVKTLQEPPVCPSGSAIPGTVQPPPIATQTVEPKVPPLDAEERRCMERYVRVAAERSTSP